METSYSMNVNICRKAPQFTDHRVCSSASHSAPKRFYSGLSKFGQIWRRESLSFRLQAFRSRMKNLIRLTVLIGLSVPAHAQTPQPVPSTGRITFIGSIREFAATQPQQFVSGAPATLVRSELTQAEEQATLEFSVALKMRNFGDLEERRASPTLFKLSEQINSEIETRSSDRRRPRPPSMRG